MHDHIVNYHMNNRSSLSDKEAAKRERNINMLDKICLIFSVLMPATTIPQIIRIYSYQVVDGLSLMMWVLYFIGVIPFLIYGIVHREKPIILLNVLWMIAQITIIAGILMYG